MRPRTLRHLPQPVPEDGARKLASLPATGLLRQGPFTGLICKGSAEACPEMFKHNRRQRTAEVARSARRL